MDWRSNLRGNMHIGMAQLINEQRKERWHHGATRDWSGLEWAGAMCGEAGEAANVAKKLLRHELGMPGNADVGAMELLEALQEECADVFLYLCLLCSHFHIDLESSVIQKFNKKSAEHGFPERL